MTQIERIEKCKKAATQIRKNIIEMTYAVGGVGAHLGGSLSMVEILAALYIGALKFRLENLEWAERDRVILSKGHAALALYPTLVQAGMLSEEELYCFKKDGSHLTAHPSCHGVPGVEFASGSIGQGLSLGVGVALALKRKNYLSSRVFVLLGDGECNEGSVWEAAASASHFQLNQLVAVVDQNQMQYDGDTKEVMEMQPIAEKWRDFGWHVCEVDGHCIEELLDVFTIESKKPFVILANTIKGKGISFMERDWRFHNSRISKEQYKQAIEELEGVV